ncbi:hypothetical protein QE361_001927 [Sphingomonas sp. SORGH_AS802]|uniref:hypothetical protein n=1 Tax=unclassified Sphingomonas TaxID=196159 RepID=UPI0028564438|nr:MULTISPECIES: hypothetical protein [unclassified Sphingomonas]MDR6126690.1 hypothetical protein [Sphingomonas sp. SORGH_AS_0438]MDR6134944.1 hypothetical protein [Sphingomonas sp. SORGH_AS_0802]
MAAAAANRILSGPVDPDLEAVLPELAHAARRIRQIESIIRLPEQRYAQRLPMLSERADLFDLFETRAGKLALPGEKPGRALLLMVEEADRLSRINRGKRRPTLAQVLLGLRAIADAAERAATEAEVDLIAARYVEIEARRRFEAGKGAVAYLEACR